jgi:hypothetical protein
MASSKSFWFRLGHAYERIRLGAAPPPTSRVPSLAQRREAREADRAERAAALPTADEMIVAGALFLVDRIVGRRARAREPGIVGLVRAGLAGAAAALVVDLVRPLLRGDASLPVLDRSTIDRLLGGAGQGLVYGALVEPRVPGPALLKGAVYGTVEYAADPLGGLSELFGAHAPQAQLPVVGALLEGIDDHERAYLEHLVFGIALALLYESSPSSKGILDDGDEDGA